jgi:hypothetical protein
MKFAAFLLVGMLVTLAVQAAPAVSTLSWDAPTTRVDGTPLQATQIEEFRVYHGIDIGPDPLAIGPEYTAVSGENATDITIELVPRAEPYVISFAITTVDRDGLESALSETVSKTFDVDSTADPAAPTSLQFTINCVDGCTVTEVTGE